MIQKKGNNRVSIKQNTNATKNSATQSQITKKQPSVSPPNSVESKLQSTNADTIEKSSIFIIMDSNRKLVNFKELLSDRETNETTPTVIPCVNLNKLRGS